MNLVSIENGWVFAKYKIDNREYCLQGSNMFGYDVIEELLSLIYIFIRNEECQRSSVSLGKMARRLVQFKFYGLEVCFGSCLYLSK